MNWCGAPMSNCIPLKIVPTSSPANPSARRIRRV
jgi:hypothetical protein